LRDSAVSPSLVVRQTSPWWEGHVPARSLHDLAVHVGLGAVDVDRVARHPAREDGGPFGGRVFVERVDVEVGVTSDGARGRGQRLEEMGKEIEAGVRDLDDHRRLRPGRLENLERRAHAGKKLAREAVFEASPARAQFRCARLSVERASGGVAASARSSSTGQ
jgi:hypothetical protein